MSTAAATTSTIAQLSEYFVGERRDVDLPLCPRGSDQARRYR